MKDFVLNKTLTGWEAKTADGKIKANGKTISEAIQKLKKSLKK